MELKQLKRILVVHIVIGLIWLAVGMTGHLPRGLMWFWRGGGHVMICVFLTLVLALVHMTFPPQGEGTTALLDHGARTIEGAGVAVFLILPMELCLLGAPIYLPLYGAWLIASGSDGELWGVSEKVEFAYLAVVCVGIGLRGYATWIYTGIKLFIAGLVLTGIGAFLIWIFE